MSRRIFISCQYEDRMKAKGFHLLRWNRNVELDVVGRHLLDPVDSTNADYISKSIREQIHGTSVTVVLIGATTSESEWVAREIEWSLEKEHPNGILGIRLEPGVSTPQALIDCGAEVIDWVPNQFGAAIERAAIAERQLRVLATTPGGMTGCVR